MPPRALSCSDRVHPARVLYRCLLPIKNPLAFVAIAAIVASRYFGLHGVNTSIFTVSTTIYVWTLSPVPHGVKLRRYLGPIFLSMQNLCRSWRSTVHPMSFESRALHADAKCSLNSGRQLTSLFEWGADFVIGTNGESCVRRLNPLERGRRSSSAIKTKKPRRTAAFRCLIPWKEIGAGEAIRTLDPNLGKVVLYP